MTGRRGRRCGVVGVLAALVTLGSGACFGVGPAGLDGPRPDDLAGARARWEAHGPDRYRYTVNRQCFCLREATGPVVVTVEDGRVVSRVRADDGAPVDEAWRDLFPTVEGLFALLAEAAERDADRVEVTFDEALGVPLHLWIDYEEIMADEEVGFETSKFEAMD